MISRSLDCGKDEDYSETIPVVIVVVVVDSGVSGGDSNDGDGGGSRVHW